MITNDRLTRVLMTPQEYQFAGLGPPVAFNPETATDWYRPYGLAIEELRGQFDIDKAQELRQAHGFIEVPRSSARMMGIQIPVGHIVGVPFARLDNFGTTVTDPRLIQGRWDVRRRQFTQIVDYTELWSSIQNSREFHLRGEGRPPRVEGKKSRKER